MCFKLIQIAGFFFNSYLLNIHDTNKHQKENEKIRNSRENEEYLMASAWYNLGADLNRKATDERIATIGTSFLAQQRRLPSGTSMPSSSSLNNSALGHVNSYKISGKGNDSFNVSMN